MYAKFYDDEWIQIGALDFFVAKWGIKRIMNLLRKNQIVVVYASDKEFTLDEFEEYLNHKGE